jgi:hypothetical protein
MVFFLHCLTATVYGLVATGPDGSNAQAVHALGYIGAGVNVGIITVSNTRTTHEAFYDKDTSGLPIGSSHAFAYNLSGDTSGIVISDHDTWIAGVIASRGGATHPDDIGVAPGVDIYNARVVNAGGGVTAPVLDSALNELVNNHNCRVIFTGFQFSTTITPDGTSIYTAIYDYYANNFNVVFANPAGNYTGSSTNITVFGDAYNGITTGGLAVVEPGVWRKVGSISNLGLTADGRRKPDLVTPSYNQTMPSGGSDTDWYTWPLAGGETSLSVPHTAGVAALLIAYTNSVSEPNYNEVIRAVIVNSTFPNIRDNSNAPTTGQLYNVARGYGRIDALRAYQTLAAASIVPDSHTGAMRGWAYDDVRNFFPDTYYVLGTKNQRLMVTLTWNRKVTKNGEDYTLYALAALGLQILDPDGLPIFDEVNAKDNLRKCDLLLSKTGEYRIKVTNSNSLTDYGLAFEIVPPITGDFDMNYIVDYRDLSILASQWLFDGAGLTADLAAPAGHVDFRDLAIFAQSWRTANNAYNNSY